MSGLIDFIETTISQWRSEPDSLTEGDLLRALRDVDRFWHLCLGEGPSRPDSPSQPTELDSSPAKLHELSASLSRSPGPLPNSIWEWRCQQYRREVGTLIQLTADTFDIYKRGDDSTRQAQVHAMLRDPLLVKVILRALDLAWEEVPVALEYEELECAYVQTRSAVKRLIAIDRP